MTAVDEPATTDRRPDLVSVTIDGTEIVVPKGTLVIRAAEMIGTQIPRFCDHPLLDPVGACRQCLVEVEGQRKPLASCTTVVTDGMVVHTQRTSDVAEKAQRGVMELLLINHPLDCPVCDKGGECPLQNQAMSSGRGDSRFTGVKRTFTKPIPLSSEVLLDRERCVLCARCTRFSSQVAGDPLIDFADRGALQQVAIYQDEPFESYFSGNTVQICPVGALTSTAYRFRARPFDLVSTPSVCEHCASGCAQRTDHRRGKVLRRLAGDDPDVNQEWNCDKGRFAFAYATAADRIAAPTIRSADGTLREVSWAHALRHAAEGLSSARGRAGVLTGGRLTAEDAYAYARFARVALDTNDIDFRARGHSGEEADFLAAHVAARPDDVTYHDLAGAPAVLLVAFEPEEESPIVFLRMRRAVRTSGQRVTSIAALRSRGLVKLNGQLLAAVPGDEAAVLDSDAAADAVTADGSVIVVGERLAGVPGGFSAAARLAERTGARLAWIPRRAGERGALEVGAAPNLLPGGRPVADLTARTEMALTWQVADLPSVPGRDTTGILDAAARQEISALLVGGVELADLPDPRAAESALADAGFVVSLEIRRSAVTDRADVVLPVAATAEKSGMFLDWEGRARPFTTALPEAGTLPDHRVLDALASQMGIDLRCADTATIRADLERIGPWRGLRPPTPAVTAPPTHHGNPETRRAVLATWRMLLDDGRLQDNEPDLAGTARPPVARMSAATAAGIGASDGTPVEVGTERGAIVLPLQLTDMVDGVVWVPMNSPGCSVSTELRAHAGDVVAIATAGEAR
ncbi:NADH-quinone oxidoreductase subunit G [Gordonia sp. PKS22-38]|uniref:NADH-quinone oxidoreductase n=1 Tax=Gordonia prachuapensis TaxID=3115651 RepID=A0ABU7MU46_9ACTN|nr:NADH-quinone oxidoreductase subunit G [Gordonia sp. PKS22-38]